MHLKAKNQNDQQGDQISKEIRQALLEMKQNILWITKMFLSFRMFHLFVK